MDEIRNVAIVGADGSGKTTLVEAALYNGKAISRFRPVEGGPPILGTDPEEAKRGLTLSSAVFGTKWKKGDLTLIDTPGEVDFAFDLRNSLLVADGAVLVLNPVPPLRFEALKAWQIMEELGVPRVIFVNGMDREKVDLDELLTELESFKGAKPVLVQYPVGKEAEFRGAVDLLRKKALIFSADGKGKVSEEGIPADLQKKVQEIQAEVLETIVEEDDQILEKYLEKGEVSEAEVEQALQAGVRNRKTAPMIFGAATKNIGVTILLDMIFKVFPAPRESRQWKGIESATGKEVVRAPEAPFAGFIFKTQVEHFTGKLSFLKVISGTLQSEATVFNSGRGLKEKISVLSRPQGKDLHSVGTGEAGTILILSKLKEAQTGDTLTDESSPIRLQGYLPSQRLISYSLKPKTRQDEERISPALAKLVEEDPSLEFKREPQTKELIISGMGQTHIDVAVEKLQRKYEVAVELLTPLIPYRETIRKKSSAQGKYKRQSGGRGQFGDTWIELEPLPRGKGFEFMDKITGGAIPRNFIPAVEKGIVEACEEGQIAGFPVVDLRASLYDGSFHVVDSSDMAFRIAASMGFKKAFSEGDPVLLEPILKIKVYVTDEYMGDVIGDLNSRRGRIAGMEVEASSQVIKAVVPMAEVVKYAADLRSITQGRGTFTYEFSHYEEIPAQIANRIIEVHKKEKEQEK